MQNTVHVSTEFSIMISPHVLAIELIDNDYAY
jgi:hypothetical protein